MSVSVVLVAGWVALAVAGDALLKAAPSGWSGVPTIALGCACYGATVPIALATYRCTTWSATALLWSGLSLLLSIIVARLWFLEPLTWRRLLSAALLFAAMGLAE